MFFSGGLFARLLIPRGLLSGANPQSPKKTHQEPLAMDDASLGKQCGPTDEDVAAERRHRRQPVA
jgi:hypothetical protein